MWIFSKVKTCTLHWVKSFWMCLFQLWSFACNTSPFGRLILFNFNKPAARVLLGILKFRLFHFTPAQNKSTLTSHTSLSLHEELSHTDPHLAPGQLSAWHDKMIDQEAYTQNTAALTTMAAGNNPVAWRLKWCITMANGPERQRINGSKLKIRHVPNRSLAVDQNTWTILDGMKIVMQMAYEACNGSRSLLHCHLLCTHFCPPTEWTSQQIGKSNTNLVLNSLSDIRLVQVSFTDII